MKLYLIGVLFLLFLLVVSSLIIQGQFCFIYRIIRVSNWMVLLKIFNDTLTLSLHIVGALRYLSK